MEQNFKIGIIGLGYVGLPLAAEFAKKYPVVGFDINQKRVNELRANSDATLEVSQGDLQEVNLSDAALLNTKNGLWCSAEVHHLEECNFYIVTVPTPVDKNNRPVLTAAN